VLDALRKLIRRRRPDRTTGTIEKEPKFIPGDRPLKAAGFLFRQKIQKEVQM
jgi:hypothetical protein